MGVGNFLIICLLIYYSFYFISLTSSKKRQTIQDTNIRLEKLRVIPNKTLEEQKEFIALKYPKKEPYKFRWKHLFLGAAYIAIGFACFFAYSNILDMFGINVPLWIAILIIIVVPIIMNLILRKFRLEKNDLLVFITGGRK